MAERGLKQAQRGVAGSRTEVIMVRPILLTGRHIAQRDHHALLVAKAGDCIPLFPQNLRVTGPDSSATV